MPGVVFVSAFGLSNLYSSAFGGAPEGQPKAPVARDMLSPTEIDTLLHGCQKVSYSSIGRFLRDRGVNINSNTAGSAGLLYRNAKDTLGVPAAEARAGESSFLTTAGATKLFDIFVQAAPEIVANIGDGAKAPACVLNGASKPMFDASGCVPESVSCILGRSAKAADVQLCNAILAEASGAADLTKKQNIAVATLLSAGNTCE